MREIVWKSVNKYEMFNPGDTLVVAASGGVDSMVLLHLLVNSDLHLNLIVCHVDHQKRVESHIDAGVVEDFCKQHGLTFEKTFLVDPKEKVNFHDYARKFRYDYLKQTASRYQATTVVTGHHAADHLESVVLHMMRGTKPKGLIGIAPKTIYDGFVLVRPLIDVTKADIYDYAAAHAVTYVEDVSNQSDVYLRNWIRHHITNEIVKKDSSILSNVRQLSNDIQLDEAYFQAQIKALIKDHIKVGDVGYQFSFQWFDGLHASIKKRLLEALIEGFNVGLYDEIITFFKNVHANGQLDLPGANSLTRAYDEVWIKPKMDSLSARDFEIEVELGVVVDLPDGSQLWAKFYKLKKNEKKAPDFVYLCYNNIRLPLKVRNRRPGDLLHLPVGKGRIKVKKLMIDEKIPVDRRATWPIVVDAEDQIVWIPGLKKTKFCKHEPIDESDIVVSFLAREADED